MCGRYTLSTPGTEIAEVFGLAESAELEPRFNIAPTQWAPVIRRSGEASRLVMCRWGLVPHWAQEPSIGVRMINARSETAHDKPAYRDSFRRRRCLVPADGFYEWKRMGRRKQPYYFGLPTARPFAMAGLWDRWPGGAEPLESFTILTTSANLEVAEVHDRMPVILAPSDWGRWLAADDEEVAPQLDLLRPVADGTLARHPVGTYVNSPANDAPRCVQAIDLSSFDDGPQPGLF